MTTAGATLLLTAIELTLVYFAMQLPPALAFRALGKICVANMVMITLLGVKMKVLFGVTLNVGDTLYAGVMLAQGVIVYRWGRAAALTSVTMVFVTLVSIFAIGQVVKAMPLVPGDEGGLAVNYILSSSTRLIFAAFIAFAIVQSIFIVMVDTLRPHGVIIAYGVSCAICQILDSLIFYSIAFAGVMSPDAIIPAVIVGSATKIIFAIVSIPLVAYAATDNRHACGGCPMDHLRLKGLKP